jgi:hypothetical protein
MDVASGNSEAASDGFDEWLSTGGAFKVWLHPSPRGWEALACDFDIRGAGSSPDEARSDLKALVTAYLFRFYVDGDPYEAALRPVGQRTRRRIELQAALGAIIHRVRRSALVAHEERVDLPGMTYSAVA